jgi:hypothetical protein
VITRRVLLVAGGGLATVLVAAGAVALLIQRALEPPAGGGPKLSTIELRLKVEDSFGRPTFCDPDSYPVGRPVSPAETTQRFTQLQQTDGPGVTAVAAHDRLPASGLTVDQQYQVWSHYQALQRIQLNSEGNHYRFQDSSSKQLVEGTITKTGRISVTHSGPPAALMCPICLHGDTLIDTPGGQVPVRDLSPGMPVWTAGTDGARQAGVVIRTGSVPTPFGHRFVRLALADGRSVLVSAGHPTGDGRKVGELAPGDQLDGSSVVAAKPLDTDVAATYDLLPSGPTGAYWANGIRLGSTLGG